MTIDDTWHFLPFALVLHWLKMTPDELEAALVNDFDVRAQDVHPVIECEHVRPQVLRGVFGSRRSNNRLPKLVVILHDFFRN